MESGPARTTVPVASCPGMKGGVAITFEEMEMIELDHCNHDLLKGRVVITFYILY